MGKGAKERTVYLIGDAKAALDDYLEARQDAEPALFVSCDRARAGSHAGQTGAEEDRRLTPPGARHVLRELRRNLGIRSLTSPHVLRHTAATALLEVAGGDVRLVQEVLGHANLNTLQVYTKIIDARKEAAYERYAEFLRTSLEQGR